MNSFQDSFISFLSQVTSLGSDKYVKEFARVPLSLEQGRTELQTDKEKGAFRLLKESGEAVETMTARYPVLKEVNERIYISVKDLNDLHLSAVMDNGKVEVSVGWDTTKRPTLLVPLFSLNLQHLHAIVSNKELDTKEIYRIARVLFVPFTRALYDADYMYTPGDKRYLKLYNLYHVEMLGMEGVSVDGFPGNAQATIANVEGQWLVFEGYQGIPKMKVTCTLDQALEYYVILMIRMKKAQDLSSLKEVFDRYMKLREETVVDLLEK